jgi:uncharacterized protein YjlB
VRVIEKDGVPLAKWIKPDDIKPGLSFFSNDDEFLQVGAWNYDAGKKLLAHIHNTVERTINRTHEVLYVISGRLEAVIYTLDAEEVKTLILEAGDVLVLLSSGHGYRILEDGTRVIEIKNGPYPGADADRRRITVEEK